MSVPEFVPEFWVVLFHIGWMVSLPPRILIRFLHPIIEVELESHRKASQGSKCAGRHACIFRESSKDEFYNTHGRYRQLVRNGGL